MFIGKEQARIEYLKKNQNKIAGIEYDLYGFIRPPKTNTKNKLSKQERLVRYNQIYKWKLRNRDKVLCYEINRRARTKWFGGTLTPEDWFKIKQKQNFRCLHCLALEPEIKLTVDHIIPIKGWLNWSTLHNPKYKCNDKENIQALCRSCNSSKSDTVDNSLMLP